MVTHRQKIFFASPPHTYLLPASTDGDCRRCADGPRSRLDSMPAHPPGGTGHGLHVSVGTTTLALRERWPYVRRASPGQILCYSRYIRSA